MDNTPANQSPVQPLPEPIAPVEPAMTPPVTSFASGNSTSIAPNGSPFKNKKMLTIVAVIVGAAVVLGIIAFVIVNLLSVSKKDYSDAAVQFNKVASSASSLSSAVSTLQSDATGSTTDTEFTNDSATVDTALQTLKDENAKLATFKAVKVGEGKKNFDAFNVKLNDYSAYVKDYTTSFKNIRPAFSACGNNSSGTDASTRIAVCVSALSKVTDLPNADIKQYVTTLQTQYASLKDLTAQVTALSDPYGKQYEQYKVLRDKRYAVQDVVSSASKDFKSNLSKHADDVDPKTVANILGDYLNKQTGH